MNDNVVEVSRSQRVRLIQAMRRMPYSGILGPAPTADHADFVDAVIEYLERLGRIQREYVDASTNSQSELMEMRREREVVRKFFGASE